MFFARLPDKDIQAVAAVSTSIHIKMKDVLIAQKSSSENIQVCGYVFRDIDGHNVDQILKIP